MSNRYRYPGHIHSSACVCSKAFLLQRSESTCIQIWNSPDLPDTEVRCDDDLGGCITADRENRGLMDDYYYLHALLEREDGRNRLMVTL